jgi:hypothetical protein
MFTPYFGIVKGRAEAALLALSKDASYTNLRPFSLRPAGIDPAAHTEIHAYLPQKKGLEKVVQAVALPVLRTVGGGFLSPTRDLARVLTDLAMGDGEKLEGAGISGEGRTINNAAMRKIAGI